jgi:hypothetical protein
MPTYTRRRIIMNRDEAITSATATYNAAYNAVDSFLDAANKAAKDAYNDATDAFSAELARINKEYPL